MEIPRFLGYTTALGGLLSITGLGLRHLKERFRGIKALCYFDMDWSDQPDGFDSRIDSSPEALQAFKESIADPYFLGKVPYRKV